MSKPRYRTYYVDVDVLAYNFGQAEVLALENLKSIESSLERPREFARLYSITLSTVDQNKWKQLYHLKFKVFSMYKTDFNFSKHYTYVQQIEKKIERLYR